MAHDREVGGIWCHEVLELLSDHLDGELDDTTRKRVLLHLDGCNWCEQFGADVGAAIQRVRGGDLAESVDVATVDRLKARLGLA